MRKGVIKIKQYNHISTSVYNISTSYLSIEMNHGVVPFTIVHLTDYNP